MANPSSPRLQAFLQALPKTETHLHIEGALPFELLQRQDPLQWAKPPRSWAADFKFRSFAEFEEELLMMATQWYISPERYHEAAKIVFRRLYEEQHVRYVETSFASGIVEFLGVSAPGIVHAIKHAAPQGMEVRVFMGIHHAGYNERTRDWLEDCVHWPDLDGIDLHGEETDPMGDWAPPLWAKARAHGKFTKAHAGEFAGPEFVRYAVDELGAQRIQHGVRSAEDPQLVLDLKARGIALDVCPISNVKLDVVPTMRDHPIRQFFDAGLTCTINTDDPMSFGNQLHEEYTALHDQLGFTIPQLGEIARNGFRVALISEELRADYLEQIDHVVAEFAE
ncbi:MAG: adenosine deaminase [Verrucomicrobiota bacterium JB022]|nr:adenosine deaminase [Verrucomicrobiota bacterium JB022]